MVENPVLEHLKLEAGADLMCAAGQAPSVPCSQLGTFRGARAPCSASGYFKLDLATPVALY